MRSLNMLTYQFNKEDKLKGLGLGAITLGGSVESK